MLSSEKEWGDKNVYTLLLPFAKGLSGALQEVRQKIDDLQSGKKNGAISIANAKGLGGGNPKGSTK